MVKKFTKRQLLDQCGFTTEETQVILDYQKKLPIFVENYNTEGFCINARDLHKELKVKTQFSKWIKSNLKTGGAIEDTDYQISLFKGNNSVSFEEYGGFTPQKLSSLGVSTEYFLTIEMSKEIAMYTGTALHASKELKATSKIVRRYFILMEKAVKKNLEWELIRFPLREGYKAMQAALNAYMNRTIQKDADEWDYRIEADALNIIATGFPAKEIRLFVGCKDNITRDSLTVTYNEYLMKLQEWNILFLGMNLNRYKRYLKLKESFDIFFPNAIPIKDDISISKIQENKKKLLEEVKSKVQRVA
uniref:AntA/AntB antirepressor n=1 Tax=Siphoviridae sp. ctZd434 TaxID=2825559 RepID=A0A8S5UH80_9CAUD|nr:MAG TPA: AntA/AntB antirepressor [Siphoviridae sp. ctZd434]